MSDTLTAAGPTQRWKVTRARSQQQYSRFDEVGDGWRVPYGPRPVVVAFSDYQTGEAQGVESWDHGTVLLIISDLIDHLTEFEPDDIRGITVATAAYEMVESDLETGTSLFAWPVMRTLVDQVLTDASNVEDKISRITTTWVEF